MKKTIEETTRLLMQGTLTKDEADKILLDLFDVSKQREQLIAFADAINICDGNIKKISGLVDLYLKSN